MFIQPEHQSSSDILSMKSATIIVFFLALSAFAEEGVKKSKRGVFGEGLHLGHSFDLGHDLGGHGFELSSHGWDSGLSYGHHHGSLDLGSSVHKHVTITQKVGVPIPQPYPVTIEKKIPVPYPVKIEVPVARPYPVIVPKPYPVTVEKPYPVTVEKHIPYPVKVPVHVPVKVAYPVPVPKPYPVTITKHVPIHVPHPIIVKKPVPIWVKSHHDEWQGGLSLGSGYGGGWKGLGGWKSW